MQNLFDKLNRWKHWHWFALIFGVTMIGMFIYFMNVTDFIMDVAQNPPEDGQIAQDQFDSYMRMMNQQIGLIFGISAFTVIVTSLWYASIGIGLQKYVPEGVRMNPVAFWISLLFNVAVIWVLYYLIAGMFGVMSSFEYIDGTTEIKNPDEAIALLQFIPYIFLLSTLVIVAQIIIFRFVARTIYQAEHQSNPNSTSDILGYFFLAWFNVIGVWFIQPVVNKIVNGEFDHSDEYNAMDVPGEYDRDN